MTARCRFSRGETVDYWCPSMEGRSRDRPMVTITSPVEGRVTPSMEGRSRDRPMCPTIRLSGRCRDPSMEGRSRDRPMSRPCT